VKHVGFTKFLDFTAQTGSAKAASALTAFYQSGNMQNSRTLYYENLREALITAERSGKYTDWEQFVGEQKDDAQELTRDALIKYYKWKSNYTSAAWYEPPKQIWALPEFDVNINPEIGLILDGEVYAIKLYLNNKKLSNLKAQAGGLIMQNMFGDMYPDTKFAILDVKAEQFHVFYGASDRLEYLLIGEAAHMSAILSAAKQKAAA
jgi:hypothetical protein